jgi:hypothetical protein
MPVDRAEIGNVLLPHLAIDAAIFDQRNQEPVRLKLNTLLNADAPPAARAHRAAPARPASPVPLSRLIRASARTHMARRDHAGLVTVALALLEPDEHRSDTTFQPAGNVSHHGARG